MTFIDIGITVLIYALWIGAVLVVYWQVNDPTRRVMDALSLAGVLTFVALFLRSADDKLNDLGLYWADIGSLSSDIVERVFVDAFFSASVWIGGIVMISLWILPDVIKLTEEQGGKKP